MVGGDPVPSWKAALRKAAVLSIVARGGRRAGGDVAGFAADVQRIRDAALSGAHVHDKVLSLWRIEGLAFAFFDGRRHRTASVRDLSMPREAGPPAHCGLAMAAVLAVGFDPDRLAERFELDAHPSFMRFCHETVGLMLAVCEGDTVGKLATGLGRLGVLRHRSLLAPPPEEFLDALPEDRRLLAAHGHGRATYFKTLRFAGAAERIAGRPGIPLTAALRGLTSAYSLVNSRDLGSLLSLRAAGDDARVADGIDGGLFNTLSLLEWTVPGCLSDLPRTTDRAERLITAAADQAETARARGLGPPMVA